jgi:diguanylate cyclase (GGDEF)-like protein
MSFKVKLVVFFALLALLPLAVSFYGYAQITRRTAVDQADARLAAELRGAVALYAGRLADASNRAAQLARSPDVQRALVEKNEKGLAAAIRRVPGAAIRTRFASVGTVAAIGGGRQVTVKEHGQVVGSVIVSVPVTGSVLQALKAPLAAKDRLVITHLGRILAGTGRGSRLRLPADTPLKTNVAGVAYRALSTPVLANSGGIGFVVLAPQTEIANSVSSTETRLALALVGSLVLIGFVTYLLGRSIVNTLGEFVEATNAIVDGRLDVRVAHEGRDEFGQLATAFNRMAGQLEERLAEVATERRRVHEVAAGFGQALAATHDEISLLQVVAESAVQATSGTGGNVMRNGREIVRTGNPEAGAEELHFPLRDLSGDYGSLTVFGNGFETETVAIAATLARQAVVALKNARLHQTVEQQALIDDLTGLANRRLIDETLRSELAMAAQSGVSVTLVFADLDHFKRVNDHYGHPCGDRVLMAFADVLRRQIRAEDLAGRWGGEEFALILVGTDVQGGVELAERARSATETMRLTSDAGESFSITASFGVASYPSVAEMTDLIAAADNALYAAKRSGRNKVASADARLGTPG